jgi:hypothetical protein
MHCGCTGWELGYAADDLILMKVTQVENHQTALARWNQITYYTQGYKKIMLGRS